MCIISGPVLSVNSTKILALPSRNGKRQLTVYRNAVATPESNAMCLPVPNPDSVKFEKVPKDIFEQCKKSFNIVAPRGGFSLSYTLSDSSSKNRPQLQVQSHGSYDVVLVPSIDDMDRIPPSFTTLSQEVKEFLTASYPNTFGIVLCRLKKGSSDYEPFAYSHDIQDNKQLFFPTKHYHVENNSSIMRSSYMDEEPGWASVFTGASLLGGEFMGIPNRELQKPINNRYADDWDHEIYSAQTPTWCHESKNKMMMATNEIAWNQMPDDFNFGSSLTLRCKEIVGHSANKDIEMPVMVA
jgi:hypothetical protein